MFICMKYYKLLHINSLQGLESLRSTCKCLHVVTHFSIVTVYMHGWKYVNKKVNNFIIYALLSTAGFC